MYRLEGRRGEWMEGLLEVLLCETRSQRSIEINNRYLRLNGDLSDRSVEVSKST